jgi:hypothetical protein
MLQFATFVEKPLELLKRDDETYPQRFPPFPRQQSAVFGSFRTAQRLELFLEPGRAVT